MTDAVKGKYMEMHSPCLSCKYNKCKDKNIDGVVEIYDCDADIDKFPCTHIPELYPHKLAKKSESRLSEIYPEQFYPVEQEPLEGKMPDIDERNLSLFEVTLYNTITDRMFSVFFLANTVSQVKAVMNRRLSKLTLSHVKIYKVKSLKEYQGYNIVAIPRQINKVYYPKFLLDIKDREPVLLEEIQLEVERKPALSPDEEGEVILKPKGENHATTEEVGDQAEDSS